MHDLGIHNPFESSADAGKEIIVDVPVSESEATCLEVPLSESEITHIPGDLLNHKPKADEPTPYLEIPLSESEIIRIPAEMLHHKPEAYEPDTVSLGPLHFGQSHLRKSEQIKNQLLSRRFPYRVSDFQKLVDRMMQDQFITRIRQWYYPNIDSVDEAGKLGSMMARDGIFLLQVLRELSPMSEFERYLSFTEIQLFADLEYIFNLEKKATRQFQLLLQPLRVQEDIMKLHNQIPLFALNKIIQWEEETYQTMTQTMLQQKAGKGKDKMLQQKPGKEKDKIHQQKAGKENEKMLQDMMLQDIILQARTGTNQDLNSILRKTLHSLSPFPDMHDWEDSLIIPESSHILGFVYRSIVGSSDSTDCTQSNEMRKNKRDLPATAVVLDNRGVKFAAFKGPLKKIRFDGNTWTFHLPRIEIDNRTDTVMRNLLAFELYICDEQMKPIKCYVELMDKLIDTAEDVQVLKNYGIIQHHLGTDQEVANMWNDMRKGHDNSGQYGPTDTAIDNVIKFHRSYRIWYAECIRKYFSKPWLVVSLIVGCIFVVTSVLQTILAWEQLRR
eukprot:PITA_14040